MEQDIQELEQKVNYSGLINSIDIRPDEFLLPLHEVVVNALQSIEDRKNPSDDGSITIKIVRNIQEKLDLENSDDYQPITGFIISDDGVGFTDRRENAFSTPFTNFNFEKGGKGMGRYTVLACFGSMDIDSRFTKNATSIHKRYKFDSVNGLRKHPDQVNNLEPSFKNKTIVTLNNYKPEYFNYAENEKVDINYIADAIIQHCLLFFISSENIPTIRLMYEGDDIMNAIILNDIYRTVIQIERKAEFVKVDEVDDVFKVNYIRNFNGVHSHSIHLAQTKDK